MSLAALVALWIPLLLVFYIVRVKRRTQGTGLVAAYLVNVIAMHWAGGLVRLFPWFPVDLTNTRFGLIQASWAMAAFIAGSLFLGSILVRRDKKLVTAKYIPHPHLPHAYLFIGIASYAAFFVLQNVPTLTSVLAAGQRLYVAGICLLCWQAIREKSNLRLAGAFLLAATIPLITIVSQGFMSYGAAAATVVYAFVGNFTKPWKTALMTALMLYFGLSFYVTYMRDRREIRYSVWGGQSLSDRVDQFTHTMSNFEWFDPTDRNHLIRVDGRMNQNLLLGVAVQRLEASQDYARGSTLWEAVLALIPRALWPEKTVVAGSSDLVTRFTGIRFAAGTSVGIGQVMEFYVNFATVGVVLGFLFFGALLTAIDEISARRLIAGDHHSFAVWFLAGISFLQAGGSLVEVTSSAAAGIVTALLVNHVLLSHMQTKRRAAARYSGPPVGQPVTTSGV